MNHVFAGDDLRNCAVCGIGCSRRDVLIYICDVLACARNVLVCICSVLACVHNVLIYICDVLACARNVLICIRGVLACVHNVLVCSRAVRGVPVGSTARNLNSVGDLQNAVAECHDNAIAEHGFGFFRVRQLVKRKAVLVVLRVENRIASKRRRESTTDNVRQHAFLAGVQVFFNQVENVVPVACKDNLIVVNPCHIAFIVICVAHDFKVLAVCINDSDSALHIVKEAECDSLAVRAEFRAVDVVVKL